MKTILVTGGAGFIGSHTTVELLKKGYEVVILDNFYNSDPSVLARIRAIAGKEATLVEGDMCDSAVVDELFARYPIDAVIHFAGYKAVGESVSKPLEYYENNLTGTLTILRLMKKHGVDKFIFSSSATVYGMNNESPYVEDMPTSATNPYGQTKVMIEKILLDLAVADKNFSAVLLRYFNPIGAHESGLLGEDPEGIPNNLVPYIARVASGKLGELVVFGDDYDTPDGTGVRDYIHVVDLARGHIAALEYADTHRGAEAINLGTGKGSSVIEVIRAYEKASGRHIPYRIAARRPGDIATCYADTKKAETLLHWTAERSLEQMCADSWRAELKRT